MLSKYDCLVIVDNHQHYKSFLEQNPTEKCLFLITGNQFPAEILLNPARYNCLVFDEILERSALREMTARKDKYLFKWFFDEQGNDLSVFNGYSLGMAMAPSVDILLANLSKYYFSLKTIIRPDTILYVPAGLNHIVSLTVAQFADQSAQIKVFKSKKTNKIYYKNKIELDPVSRFRDLSPFFGKKTFSQMILFFLNLGRSFFLKIFIKKPAVIIDAGKLNFLYENLDKLKEIPLALKFNRRYFSSKSYQVYRFDYWNLFSHHKEVRKITEALILQLAKNPLGLPPALLQNIFDEYILKYAMGFYDYCKGVELNFKAMQPSCVVIPSCCHETHLIQAMAAKKLRIRTILTSHGAMAWFYREFSTTYCLFDEIWANSKAEKSCYEDLEIPSDRIKILPIPHFFKIHLQSHKTQNNGSKKAVIFLEDFNNMNCSSRITDPLKNAFVANKALRESGYEIIGLKVRGSFEKEIIAPESDEVNFQNAHLKIISKEIDLSLFNNLSPTFIGGYGSATLESVLLGQNYYVFDNGESRFYGGSLNVHRKSLDSAINYDELKNNLSLKKSALINKDKIIESSLLDHSLYWEKFKKYIQLN